MAQRVSRPNISNKMQSHDVSSLVAELTQRLGRTKEERDQIAGEIEALNKERAEITSKID